MARRALTLLGEAGYAIKDDVLVERTSSRPFAFRNLLRASGLNCHWHCRAEATMNGLIYLVGLVVVIMFILSFLGLR